jgi:hypothetical protein
MAGEALVEALSRELRAKVVYVESVRAAVADAGVVCTATSAEEPLLLGEMLAPGTHVNAVGSFRPEMKEFDAELIRGARVFVDSVEACLEEAGELIAAREVGTFAHRLPADMVVTNPEHVDHAEEIWKLPHGLLNTKPGFHAVQQAVHQGQAAGAGHLICTDGDGRYFLEVPPDNGLTRFAGS